MHHLLVTLGSHGDVHPFIGLGARLKQRGHRVTLAANELFKPAVETAGLEFAPLGRAEKFQEVLHHPDLWHPRRGGKFIIQEALLPMVRPTFELVQRIAAEGETIVTAHAIAFGARIAQEKLGVPLATIHLAPAVLRSGFDPPKMAPVHFMRFMPAPLIRLFWKTIDRRIIDPLLAPIKTFRAELGLPPVSRLFEWWMSPQLVIGLFPDWFAAPQPDWPPQVRLTGFPLYDERSHHELSAEVEQFLNSGRPPIVFTFGSAMTQATKQIAASIEAAQKMNHRALILTRHANHLPATFPPTVRHITYAPFSELLPRCAALVHHGGIGTTAQALASGIPQLIVPFAHDQFDNADRVQNLGCGAQLSQSKYQPRFIAKVLQQLNTDPTIAALCKAIARRIPQSNPTEAACDAIEQLAALQKSPIPLPV